MSCDTVIERREQAPVYYEFLSYFNHINVLIFVLPGAPFPNVFSATGRPESMVVNARAPVAHCPHRIVR
jgi:hypothetical protein